MADPFAEDLERRLKDAGKTLMMLPMPLGEPPADSHAVWPKVLQKYWDQLGPADEGTVEERAEDFAEVKNATRLLAGRAAMGRLDEVLGLLLVITRPHRRKAVMARMLTHPVSGLPVYNWKQIAKTMGTSKSAVRHWRTRGFDEILLHLAQTRRKKHWTHPTHST